VKLGRNAFVALLLFAVFRLSVLAFNVFMLAPTVKQWFTLPVTNDVVIVMFVTFASLVSEIIIIGFAVTFMSEAYVNWRGEKNNKRVISQVKPVEN
jgi:hypothetical protein